MANRTLSVAEAAGLLHTSPPTVRKLIRSGELGGTISAAGPRDSFVTTATDVQTFLDTRGPYPHRNPSPKSRLSQLEQRVRTLEGAGSDLKVKKLREVIRSQNQASDHLAKAVEMQTKAADYLRLADAAHAEALTAALAAFEAQRDIARLHGIPEDAADLASS